MNIEDLKGKTPDELQKLLLDLRKEQLNARFQRTQGTLENTAQIRKTRRNIARIKTLLKSPKSQGETASKGKPKKAAAKAKTSSKKKAA